MWNDKIQDRFWWHSVKGSVDELFYELAKAEDEEEIGFYLLDLYRSDKADFNCFTKDQEKRIKKYLTLLIDETLKHRALISEIVNELRSLKHDPIQEPT